jgi:spore coat polysaccharide biosynthesis protein SpsF (cytidylyltransferase family)
MVAINVLAIVQARMGSSRLPGKVMKPILGKPLIGHLLDRLSQSKHIDKIILATTLNSEDKTLAEYVSSLGFDVFRGSVNDVLDRYYHTAKKYRPTCIVRITGDCPLIDSRVTDRVIKYFLNHRIRRCVQHHSSNLSRRPGLPGFFL